MTPPDNTDRPRRPGSPGGSGRPGGGRPSGGRPGSGRSGGSDDRRGGRGRDDSPDRGGRGGARRDDRPARSGDSRPEKPRTPREDAPDQPVFPPITADIAPDMLDRQARRELSGLGKDDAEFVAKHLVMASVVVDDDPALAHEHAKAALHRGSRIPVVRETMGITAYLVGDYALALRELRTHRRLSGSNAQLPMMIDAERGLGRPERGIELARGVDRNSLGDQWAVELAIALSGCRLDMGQTEQALTELDIVQLDPTVAFSYSPDLFDAYAVVLEDLGRLEEAALWGERATVAARALSDKNWSEKDGVGDIVDTLDGDEAAEEPVPAQTPEDVPDTPVDDVSVTKTKTAETPGPEAPVPGSSASEPSADSSDAPDSPDADGATASGVQ